MKLWLLRKDSQDKKMTKINCKNERTRKKKNFDSSENTIIFDNTYTIFYKFGTIFSNVKKALIS